MTSPHRAIILLPRLVEASTPMWVISAMIYNESFVPLAFGEGCQHWATLPVANALATWTPPLAYDTRLLSPPSRVGGWRIKFTHGWWLFGASFTSLRPLFHAQCISPRARWVIVLRPQLWRGFPGVLALVCLLCGAFRLVHWCINELVACLKL